MHGEEAIERFDCFGSRCTVLVRGADAQHSAREAAAHAKLSLLSWHARFSRFLADSELSMLNRDLRETVPVSRLMAGLAAGIRLAGSATGGLADATMGQEIEAAGYTTEPREPLTLEQALRIAPPRRPGGPSELMRWRALEVDLERNKLTRPPGVKLDSGGIAKGLFADVLGARLAGHASFAIDCAGDVLVGGSAGLPREIEVENPFNGHTLHTFSSSHTGVATSGIGRRAWRGRDGAAAHHLLDPATGRPAFTGVVQATALAPSTLLAEAYAKAAVLSGPHGAKRWLRRHGGVIVLDDGSHVLIAPAAAPSPQQALSKRAAAAHTRAA